MSSRKLNPLEREFGRKAMYRMWTVVRLARCAREAFVHVSQDRFDSPARQN
jgi:hypothetical protein